jgi:hypothetical protein
MKFKLADDAEAEIRYSPTEREVFDLIPPLPRRVSSREIVRRMWDGKAPYHALSSINSALNGLASKIELNDEPFRVRKSVRAGPHPIDYWIEKV